MPAPSSWRDPSGRARRLLRSSHRIGRLLRRLSACFKADAQLCLHLLVWRVSLPALKFIIPLPVLARAMWAGPSALSTSSGGGSRSGPKTVLQVVRNGGRLLVSGNCLERSLVLYRYLSRSGANPRLVVGVSRTNGKVSGHTWVELNGRPVHDPEAAAFERVATFGPNGRLVPASVLNHAPS